MREKQDGKEKEKLRLIFLHRALHLDLNYRVYFLAAFELALRLRWGYGYGAEKDPWSPTHAFT